MKKYYLLFAVVITVCSCKSGKDAKNQQGYSTCGDTICISQQSQLHKKIKTETADLLSYNETFTASGVVKAIPNDYVKIASPFAGRITKSYVRLGQKVKEGSPLFEISSEAFFEAVKNYSQARQELRAAYINMKRERDLVNNKVGAKKEEEDAELNYAMKKRELENAKSALSVYHISPRQAASLRPLVVRSPISGEVVSTDIVTGQYLKEDADPIATIANLNKVWVVAHVKEKDICLVRNLLKVNIELVSLPGKLIVGKVYHIGEIMDEETHSVEVIVECNNTARLMKPGMYGSVKLFDRPSRRIIIPSSAILQEENSTYVFVAVGKDKYMKRAVHSTLSADGGKAVITSGLQQGDVIISQGAFYLNNLL
jgi:cobalt-zinc-cadmium efflux system membrane fusion protein